jgi:RNA binding exosome subunit
MVQVQYYSVGVKEEVECNFSLAAGSNNLVFESDKFEFRMAMKDKVDAEEFINLLEKKQKKAILYCRLKNAKEYDGKRKVIWRGDNIAVSVGGVRLEFEKDAQDKMNQVARLVKDK